mgnify:CR=1 FL=1
MKYLLASLFLFSSMSFGQVIVQYEDGTAYTLDDSESVFISTQPVFSKKTYSTGAVYFTPVESNTKRDFVASPTTGTEVGSNEWCAAYVPWSEGFTFNMQTWQRFCDTNRDGEYGEGDAGWEG